LLGLPHFEEHPPRVSSWIDDSMTLYQVGFLLFMFGAVVWSLKWIFDSKVNNS
jgi:hypothetical protein